MANPDFDSPRTDGVPAVEAEPWTELLAATQAAAAYLSAGRIDVRNWNELSLFIDADAAAAADRLALIVMVSNAAEMPAATDDSWFIPHVTDGAVTIGAGAGAVPASFDYTLLPAAWGQVLLNPGEYRLPAFGGATEEGRPAIVFNVRRFRWAQVLYADFGGATRQTISIKYARSV